MPTTTIKLKNGQEVDTAKLARMKKMMVGRAKAINGDENNIYFPPVSSCLVARVLHYRLHPPHCCMHTSFPPIFLVLSQGLFEILQAQLSPGLSFQRCIQEEQEDHEGED